MKEEINRVKVFQDVVGEWWLEFYANDVRHQVTIQDVINGLASWVNMQATNAVLHERIDDLESAQQSVHPTVLTHCPNDGRLLLMGFCDQCKTQYPHSG